MSLKDTRNSQVGVEAHRWEPRPGHMPVAGLGKRPWLSSTHQLAFPSGGPLVPLFPRSLLGWFFSKGALG